MPEMQVQLMRSSDRTAYGLHTEPPFSLLMSLDYYLPAKMLAALKSMTDCKPMYPKRLSARGKLHRSADEPTEHPTRSTLKSEIRQFDIGPIRMARCLA